MRPIAIAILLLVLCCGSDPLFAQGANESAAKDRVATSLVEMERQWAEVCATHDTSVLERILADDFLGTNTEGKHYTKFEDIEKIRRSTKRYKSGRLDDVKVRFYGIDIAVLQGVETCVRETNDGKEEPETAIWTDTWIRRNGLWQIVAAQDAIYQTAAQETSGVISEPGTSTTRSGYEMQPDMTQQILATDDAAIATHSPQSVNSPQPPLEMQSLAKAFEGKWRINEKYEPDEWTPNGGVGYGEEIWRSGPGGFTFMEEVHDQGPAGESFGLAFIWWDKDKGFQGLWCENHNPHGCDHNAGSSTNPNFWDGKQQIVDNEFQRNGKTFRWHEVFSDITPTSFVQTADIGEKGGPLKRWLTIHATRIQERPMQDITKDSDEAELRAVMAERRKASIEGDVETIANSMVDDYVQTDIYGYRQNKTAWLNEYFKPLADLIKAGKFHWDVYEQKNLEFRPIGKSTVVIGDLEARGSGAKPGPQHTWVADPKESFGGTLHFTHVYVKRNGKWMLAALHNQLPLPPTNGTK